LCISTSFSGVLTGCGKQKIGAITNLGAFYLAGIPMAVLLAFVFHMNGMVCIIVSRILSATSLIFKLSTQ
jgi:MATE family multidrug resistance protein